MINFGEEVNLSHIVYMEILGWSTWVVVAYQFGQPIFQQVSKPFTHNLLRVSRLILSHVLPKSRERKRGDIYMQDLNDYQKADGSSVLVRGKI